MLARAFETYPPSSFVVSVAAAIAMVVGGLHVVIIVLIGAGVAMVGMRLDRWGVHDGDR